MLLCGDAALLGRVPAFEYKKYENNSILFADFSDGLYKTCSNANVYTIILILGGIISVGCQSTFFIINKFKK